MVFWRMSVVQTMVDVLFVILLLFRPNLVVALNSTYFSSLRQIFFCSLLLFAIDKIYLRFFGDFPIENTSNQKKEFVLNTKYTSKFKIDFNCQK